MRAYLLAMMRDGRRTTGWRDRRGGARASGSVLLTVGSSRAAGWVCFGLVCFLLLLGWDGWMDVHTQPSTRFRHCRELRIYSILSPVRNDPGSPARPSMGTAAVNDREVEARSALLLSRLPGVVTPMPDKLGGGGASQRRKEIVRRAGMRSVGSP
ncbi:hypothetical protein F4824DRAFT_399242 [Ustulina deusta]|nr:hypothetical protein F4824DRAFT_399242 [Ustulina deusta]